MSSKQGQLYYIQWIACHGLVIRNFLWVDLSWNFWARVISTVGNMTFWTVIWKTAFYELTGICCRGYVTFWDKQPYSDVRILEFFFGFKVELFDFKSRVLDLHWGACYRPVNRRSAKNGAGYGDNNKNVHCSLEKCSFHQTWKFGHFCVSKAMISYCVWRTSTLKVVQYSAPTHMCSFQKLSKVGEKKIRPNLGILFFCTLPVCNPTKSQTSDSPADTEASTTQKPSVFPRCSSGTTRARNSVAFTILNWTPYFGKRYRWVRQPLYKQFIPQWIA